MVYDDHVSIVQGVERLATLKRVVTASKTND